MNATLVIALRELDESRYVFALALLTGFLPFGLLLSNPRLDLGTAALIIATALGGAIALMTGSGSIAGPLANRNLSFFFCQPSSGWAIWTGKMLGATLLSLAAAALALLPTWFTGSLQHFSAEVWIAMAISIPAIVFCAHAAGVVLRTRSPWLLLDLAGLTLSLLLITQLAHVYLPLAPVFSSLAARLVPFLVFLASLATLAAILAGGVQTVVGRTESIRSHRYLSCTFWTVFGMLLALSLACCTWLVHPRLNELDFFTRVIAAETGPWAVLEGFDQDRLPGTAVGRQFLLDTSSGRSFPLASGAGWSKLKKWSISADGSLLLGYQQHMRDAGSPVFLVDLQASSPIVEETGWQTSGDSLLALSDDGSRVAILDGRLRMKVLDSTHRQILASWRLELPVNLRNLRGDLRFLEPNRLRVTLIQENSNWEALVFDVDLQSRETQILRRFFGRHIYLAPGNSPVLVVRQESGTGLLDVLRLGNDSLEEDASSLDIWIDSPEVLLFARSLGDSIALAVKVGKSTELRFFGDRGPGPTLVPFEGDPFSLFAGLRRDEVLLCPGSCLSTQTRQLLRVSSSTGTTDWLDEELHPLVILSVFGWDDPISSGSISSRLLRNAGNDLVLLDENGEVEKILVEVRSRTSG